MDVTKINNLFIITFFAPLVIVSYLFIRAYNKYLKIYRRIINPNDPLLPGEAGEYFKKNPSKFIKKLIFMPIMRWKILFEKNDNSMLVESGEKTRRLFYTLLITMFLDFLIHTLFIFNKF